MRILVAGGAGYIGSHTCISLLHAGHQIVVVDNLSTSSIQAVRAVKSICKKDFTFYQQDVRNKEALCKIMQEEKIDAVLHFAGWKAVKESVENPIAYYDNNVNSTLSILQAMKKASVHNIVFSSSATVYGFPKSVPILEDAELSPYNPYGRTKYFSEEIMLDYYRADPSFFPVILRYFNPIGAHESGEIGESPKGIPNNLAPYITQVAIGTLKELNIFGNDYPTPDGTCIRDYIHVMDLAEGHVAALSLFETSDPVPAIYNLGTGKGTSVLELVQAFSEAIRKTIPYSFAPRREGDVPAYYADVAKAQKELNWVAKRSIHQMCADAWRWQMLHPNGFQ